MSDRTRKLVSIRHRTDHDLLILVSREIDRGFGLVDVAAFRNSPLFTRAEKALSTTTALVPRIAGLSESDRLRIEGKVKELRSRLDQIPMRSFPASVAS